jgi:hypothetical protein
MRLVLRWQLEQLLLVRFRQAVLRREEPQPVVLQEAQRQDPLVWPAQSYRKNSELFHHLQDKEDAHPAASSAILPAVPPTAADPSTLSAVPCAALTKSTTC